MFLEDSLYDVHRKSYEILPKHLDRLLDICCQEGMVTKFYLKKSKLTVGVDFKHDFLVKAKESNPELALINSFAENLPFKDRVFDYAILTETLGCLFDKVRCIEETYRIMRPQGKLIITVPQRGLFSFLDPDNFKFYFPTVYRTMYYILKNKLPTKSLRFSKGNDYYPHYNFRDIRLLLDKKFKILKVHRGGLLIYPISIWINYFFNTFQLKNKSLLKLINRISDIEYRVSFGKFAYNLLVVAKKI